VGTGSGSGLSKNSKKTGPDQTSKHYLCSLLTMRRKKEKKNYIDFKCVVWHESFCKLLETVFEHSHTGFWVKCGNGITHHLFLMILILSADYEEQYVFKFASFI
jgi:hypothetical protein